MCSEKFTGDNCEDGELEKIQTQTEQAKRCQEQINMRLWIDANIPKMSRVVTKMDSYTRSNLVSVLIHRTFHIRNVSPTRRGRISQFN